MALRIRVLCLALLAIGPISTEVIAEESIGTAVSVRTSITGNGGRAIATAAPVFRNERVRANASGLGQFKLRDGSKFVVGPNASVKLDSAVYSGSTTSFKKLSVSAVKGAFRFISGKSRKTAYRISTPTGTLGIRGTAFDLTIRGGQTHILLLRGSLRFCTRSGQCRVLRRPCEYVSTGSRKAFQVKHLGQSGLSRGAVRRLFPFVLGQGRLRAGFRQGTRGCVSVSAPTDSNTTQQAAAPNAAPAAANVGRAVGFGNPGNNNAVGRAGETPGGGNFAGGSVGRGDVASGGTGVGGGNTAGAGSGNGAGGGGNGAGAGGGNGAGGGGGNGAGGGGGNGAGGGGGNGNGNGRS